MGVYRNTMLLANSDLTSSILSRSPIIRNSVETLGESSSPIASIGANVVQSLALSSPNRDHDDHQCSLSTEVTVPLRNSDGNSSTSLNKALIDGECNDSRVLPESEIQIGSTSQAPDNMWDACISDLPERRKQWTPNVSPDYDTDDESSMEWNQFLLRFKQDSLKIDEPRTVGAGLWNLGNTCFVNSVLQCFTHTVPLIDSLCSYKPQDPCYCGNESICVLKALRGHIVAALTTSRYSIVPYFFVDNLNYFSPDFHHNQQEDAHEFLQAFLDKLERCCLNRRSDRGNISSQDVNIVEHVFGGRLISRLRCCNCNSVSETFESSIGLSLEIEDVDNLSSALDSFTHVEKLEEQLTCDNCKKKVSKEKQLLLDNLPLVATFHLKRFKNNGYFMEKIFKHVRFPLELDLQPYMSCSQNNRVSTKYNLYAIVEHCGLLAYGHYNSYVRSAPKTWHKFDDEQVARIDEDSVLSQDSYILFYAREGTPWFSRASEETQPLVEVSLQNSSPKSVLGHTSEKCLSDISYESVDKSNKPCDSTGVSNLKVMKEEDFISLSNESNEDVSLSSAEFSGKDSSMAELLDDDSVPLLMFQNQESCPKQQGTFQIELECLETAKKQEEEPCKQPLLVSDCKETGFTDRDLMKKPSACARELEQTIHTTASPSKKLKSQHENLASVIWTQNQSSCRLS